jgi:hypothetical protein
MDSLSVPAENVLWSEPTQPPRRPRSEERVHGEPLPRAEIVRRRTDRLRAHQRTPRGPPERDLSPAAAVEEAQGHERRPGHALEGQPVQRDVEQRGKRLTVALVTVDELEHPGGLAEHPDPLLDLVAGDWIDDPDTAAVLQRVRGTFDQLWLGRNPADAEACGSEEADLHAGFLPGNARVATGMLSKLEFRHV